MFATAGRLDCDEPEARSSLTRGGRVLPAILLNTSCSHTLVRRDLVPGEKLLQGEGVVIRCSHSDAVVYPLARPSTGADRWSHSGGV